MISNNIASFLLDLVELLNIFHVQCNQTWWVRWKHLTCSSRCSQWYRLYIPVFTLHLSIVVKNILLQRSHNYGVWNYWYNSSTAYVILYKLIDTWFLDSNRRVGVWLLPWRWHILSIPLTTGRGTSAETCGLDDVFPPWFPSRSSVYIYIYMYIYMWIPYEFCYRTYIQWECHSILAKLHPIRFYRIVFLGSARFLGWMPPFFWFTNCVLLFDKSLILGCLWPLVFVLNNTLILGIWCSRIPHLPGCFCPWAFFFYRIQHSANGPLYVTSSYSTWIFCRGVSGFATDCPCGVWCRGLTSCLLHVGPPFGNRILNNSWAVGLT